ncbi:MAG: glutathione S-transferase [Pseudomonadota bacterium]
MSGAVLYSFRRCPYAMRARMAIKAAGVAVELREVLLKDKPAAMLEASAKGTVPVLVLPDGAVIDESLDVMHWALQQYDPFGWLNGDAEESDALIGDNDGPFKRHLDRYKYATRYDDADPAADREAGAAFLHTLNRKLEGGGSLLGDLDTLVDIALFPFVRQFRIADPDWFDAAEWPALHAWLARLTQSALFQSVMEKYAPWTSGAPGVKF